MGAVHAESVIDRPLTSPPLPVAALPPLQQRGGPEVSLGEVLRWDWLELEHGIGLSPRLFNRFAEWVHGEGLELYLTENEILHVRQTGVLPPISIKSRYERLIGGYSVRRSLRYLGITHVEDLQDYTLERFRMRGFPARLVSQVEVAVRPLGITFPKSVAEAEARRRGDLAADRIPLDQLGLPASLINTLQRHKIWNVYDLLARADGDLWRLPKLSGDARQVLADVLILYGHTPLWTVRLEELDLPPELEANLLSRHVHTLEQLQKFVRSTKFTKSLGRTPEYVQAMREALVRHKCASWLDEDATI